jgi:hypothetical protein
MQLDKEQEPKEEEQQQQEGVEEEEGEKADETELGVIHIVPEAQQQQPQQEEEGEQEGETAGETGLAVAQLPPPQQQQQEEEQGVIGYAGSINQAAANQAACLASVTKGGTSSHQGVPKSDVSAKSTGLTTELCNAFDHHQHHYQGHQQQQQGKSKQEHAARQSSSVAAGAGNGFNASIAPGNEMTGGNKWTSEIRRMAVDCYRQYKHEREAVQQPGWHVDPQYSSKYKHRDGFLRLGRLLLEGRGQSRGRRGAKSRAQQQQQQQQEEEGKQEECSRRAAPELSTAGPAKSSSSSAAAAAEGELVLSEAVEVSSRQRVSLGRHSSCSLVPIRVYMEPMRSTDGRRNGCGDDGGYCSSTSSASSTGLNNEETSFPLHTECAAAANMDKQQQQQEQQRSSVGSSRRLKKGITPSAKDSDGVGDISRDDTGGGSSGALCSAQSDVLDAEASCNDSISSTGGLSLMSSYSSPPSTVHWSLIRDGLAQCGSVGGNGCGGTAGGHTATAAGRGSHWYGDCTLNRSMESWEDFAGRMNVSESEEGD